jgi:hypothetical protein
MPSPVGDLSCALWWFRRFVVSGFGGLGGFGALQGWHSFSSPDTFLPVCQERT